MIRKRLNASIDLWLRCVVVLPALTIIHWSLAFIPYAIVLVTCSWRLLYTGKNRKEIPVWLIAQAAILLFLTPLYIGDVPTLLNIGALLATNLMFMVLFLCVPNTEQSLVYVFIKLRAYMLFLAVYGLVVSTVLSGPMGLDNPVSNLLSRERVRIFSKGFGHSPLIDVGVLTFVITLAMFDKRKIRRDVGLLACGLVLIFLGKAAIGYIGISAAVLVFGVEKMNVGKYYKNLIYLVLAPTFIFLYANYGDQILLNVRTFQVGSRTLNAGYGSRDDLSAGRDELNYFLERLIEKSPWIGSGVTNKILQEGLKDKNGQLIARVESPLRTGVKYGVIYMGLILILCFYSSLILLTSDTRFRIIGMSLSLYNLDGFIGNGLFETPQVYSYFLAVFPTILIGEYAIRSRSAKSPPRYANRQAFATARPMR